MVACNLIASTVRFSKRGWCNMARRSKPTRTRKKTRSRARRGYEDSVNFHALSATLPSFHDTATRLNAEVWAQIQKTLAKYADPQIASEIKVPYLGVATSVTQKFNASIRDPWQDGSSNAIFSEDMYVVADSVSLLFYIIESSLGAIGRSDLIRGGVAVRRSVSGFARANKFADPAPPLEVLSHIRSEQTSHPNDRTLPMAAVNEVIRRFDEPHFSRSKTNSIVGLVRFLVAGHELSHHLLGHLSDAIATPPNESRRFAESVVDDHLLGYSDMRVSRNREVQSDVLAAHLIWKCLQPTVRSADDRLETFSDLYYSTVVLMTCLEEISGAAPSFDPEDRHAHPPPLVRQEIIKHALTNMCGLRRDDVYRRAVTFESIQIIAFQNIARKARGEAYEPYVWLPMFDDPPLTKETHD